MEGEIGEGGREGRREGGGEKGEVGGRKGIGEGGEEEGEEGGGDGGGGGREKVVVCVRSRFMGETFGGDSSAPKHGLWADSGDTQSITMTDMKSRWNI